MIYFRGEAPRLYSWDEADSYPKIVYRAGVGGITESEVRIRAPRGGERSLLSRSEAALARLTTPRMTRVGDLLPGSLGL